MGEIRNGDARSTASRKEIVYFIGAGLSKSLQLASRPIPAMWDFISTMAEYLDDDIVLTTMAELENAGVYQWQSDEAALLARRVVGKAAERTPTMRHAFRQALKKPGARLLHRLNLRYKTPADYQA